MEGLREQVYRYCPYQFVSCFGKTGYVSCPSGGIAADVGYTFGFRCGDAFGNSLGKAGARRVYHKGIEVSQGGQLTGAVAADNFDFTIDPFHIATKIAYGRSRRFDGEHIVGALRQWQRESACTAV